MGTQEQQHSNGWTQYQKLVLSELQRHSESLEKINAEVATLNIEIATMKMRHKVQSSLWGFVGALVPVGLEIYIAHH